MVALLGPKQLFCVKLQERTALLLACEDIVIVIDPYGLYGYAILTPSNELQKLINLNLCESFAAK